MGQMGFFDVSTRYAGLDAKADPLVKLSAMVPWEDFRPRLEAVWRRPSEARKSKAGRKPWDAVVIFKALVLCELYNLSLRRAVRVPGARSSLGQDAFWAWVWRIRFRTRRRSGNTASSWSRPRWSTSCSARSTAT